MEAEKEAADVVSSTTPRDRLRGEEHNSPELVEATRARRRRPRGAQLTVESLASTTWRSPSKSVVSQASRALAINMAQVLAQTHHRIPPRVDICDADIRLRYHLLVVSFAFLR